MLVRRITVELFIEGKQLKNAQISFDSNNKFDGFSVPVSFENDAKLLSELTDKATGLYNGQKIDILSITKIENFTYLVQARLSNSRG